MTTSPFPDLRSLSAFDQEVEGTTLDLPIDGHTYTFSGRLTFRTGKRIKQLRQRMDHFITRAAAGETVDPDEVWLTNEELEELAERLIGEANLSLMEERGVLGDEVRYVGMTLIAWHMAGREAALATWTATQSTEGDARPPGKSGKTRTKPGSTGNSRRSSGRNSSNTGTRSKPTSTANTTST